MVAIIKSVYERFSLEAKAPPKCAMVLREKCEIDCRKPQLPSQHSPKQQKLAVNDGRPAECWFG